MFAPKLAHKVPVAIFELLSAAHGVEAEESYAIEASSWVSRVRKLERDLLTPAWISLTEPWSDKPNPNPMTCMELWPMAPARKDAFGPREIFTLRGGPRDGGVWMAHKGQQYITDVSISFNRSGIDVSEEWGQKFVPFLAEVLRTIAAASVNVERVVTWSGAEK